MELIIVAVILLLLWLNEQRTKRINARDAAAHKANLDAQHANVMDWYAKNKPVRRDEHGRVL